MTPPLQWFALLTRSNFEQTVFDAVSKKKIQAFLPKTRKKSSRKDRHLMIEVPLFPGYIFVRSTQASQDQLPILKTVGAVRLLGTAGGPVAVPDHQIAALKLLTSAGTDLITGATVQLTKGDPVMILEGPMAGLRGEFFSHKGRGRVIVRVDLLGQFAGVEVDLDNIEKIPDLLA